MLNVFQIIAGVLLFLSSIAIIVFVMMQDSTDGMSSAVTGDMSQSYFSNNRGRTKEDRLKKATAICVVILFVLTLAVSVVSRFVK